MRFFFTPLLHLSVFHFINLVHKKGMSRISKVRPISMLSIARKVFIKIVANRITVSIDFIQLKDKAGFRNCDATIVHIHTVNQAIDKGAEHNESLCITFIDYETASDSAKISVVKEALQSHCVEEGRCEKTG